MWGYCGSGQIKGKGVDKRGGVKKEMGGVGMLLWGGLEKGRGVEKIMGGGQKKGEPKIKCVANHHEKSYALPTTMKNHMRCQPRQNII